MSGEELLACLGTAVFAPQPFAVDQARAGQFRADPGTAEPLDRLAVQAIGSLALAQQRPRARSGPERPVAAADTGGLREPPLTTAAALVWSGDLPRLLQQVLFDTADGVVF